jgi:hypothetical protein
MAIERSEPTRVVEFHRLSSLSDAHPIVVKRGCHAIDVALSI